MDLVERLRVRPEDPQVTITFRPEEVVALFNSIPLERVVVSPDLTHASTRLWYAYEAQTGRRIPEE
jgi:hypothetical protein